MIFHSGTSQNMNSRGAHPKLDQIDAEPKQQIESKKRESPHTTAIQVTVSDFSRKQDHSHVQMGLMC